MDIYKMALLNRIQYRRFFCCYITCLLVALDIHEMKVKRQVSRGPKWRSLSPIQPIHPSSSLPFFEHNFQTSPGAPAYAN
jgi:hypothetical protein